MSDKIENKLPADTASGAPTCSICLMCGRDFNPLNPKHKLCVGCVIAVIEEPEDSQKLRIRRLMGKHRAIKSGNAGVTPEGEIVDRRNYPKAMKYQT